MSSFNNPKRQRIPPIQHQNHRQTRVVFVRGLPPDCSESELLALCCPFAVVEKSFMIPQKAQAFIQLPDVLSATNLINFYQTRDAVIRGKRVYFEFSSREEITNKGENHHLDSIHGGGFHDHTQDMQQQMVTPSVPSYEPPVSVPAYNNPPPSTYSMEPPSGPTYGRRGGPGIPSAILMVMVSKVEYDVTADVLQQVFQKFGNVQRIITFWKNNECKALIQMESIEQAQAAQGALDGRDIYTGCNTLHIIFSRHTELKVRFNNERSRDYLDPNIPQGPPVGPGYLGVGGGGSSGNTGFEEYDQEPPYDEGDPGYGAPSLYQPLPQGGPPPSYPPGPGPEPGPEPYGDPYYNRGPPRDRRDRSRSRSRDRGGRGDRLDYEERLARLPPHSTGRSMRSDAIRSSTLICSNMDSRLVTVDRVFTFFGCFGDVERIKIMFRKQDTALIQFVDEVHAISALDHLDGVVVFGKKLRVDYSKHPNVSMPRGEVDRFELENTREFTNSPLHRYRRRSPSEAVSPCPLLHVSGIPQDLQNNQTALVELFAQHGTVKTFHYLLKSANMAMVEMGTVDEAIMALLTLDNLTYPDSHMRVSFSKAYIHPNAGPPGGPGGYSGRGDSPPRDRFRERDRSRDRPGPPIGRDRSRSRDRGGFGGRGGDGYRRLPPPGRY